MTLLVKGRCYYYSVSGVDFGGVRKLNTNTGPCEGITENKKTKNTENAERTITKIKT
jgi:hypothetical protein